MNEQDTRAGRFQEDDANDDNMLAEGTALTNDRAEALERVAAGEDLSEDDHANLSGLADGMEQDLKNLMGGSIPEEDMIEYAIEEMGRLREFHRMAESEPGPDAAASWELAVSLLRQNNSAYDTPAVEQLGDRLEARAIAQETAQAEERDSGTAQEPVNETATTLTERGYSESDVARVTGILQRPETEIGRSADAVGTIERREGLISAGALNENAIRSSLVEAYAIRAEVERSHGNVAAAETSMERMREHAAMVDTSSVGIVDLERVALRLAGNPVGRQEEDIIVKFAGAGAERAAEIVAESDRLLRDGEMLYATSGDPSESGMQSSISGDLERGLTMSGLVAAYGQQSKAEQELLRHRESGAEMMWNQEYEQTMSDLRESGAPIAQANFLARAEERRKEEATGD